MQIIETTKEIVSHTTKTVPYFTVNHPIYGTISSVNRSEVEEILEILAKVKAEWVEIDIPKDSLLSIREMDLGINLEEYSKVKYIIHPFSWVADHNLTITKVPRFFYSHYSKETRTNIPVVIQEITATGIEKFQESNYDMDDYNEVKTITRLKY